MRTPIPSSRVGMRIHIHLEGSGEDHHLFAFLKGSCDDPHSFLKSRDRDSKGQDEDTNAFQVVMGSPIHSLRVVGY